MSHEKAVYKLRQTICFPHLGPSKPNRLKNSKQNSKSENQWQSAIPLPESVLPEPLKKFDLQSLSQGQNNYNIGFHNLLSRLKLRASSSASKSKSNILFCQLNEAVKCFFWAWMNQGSRYIQCSKLRWWLWPSFSRQKTDSWASLFWALEVLWTKAHPKRGWPKRYERPRSERLFDLDFFLIKENLDPPPWAICPTKGWNGETLFCLFYQKTNPLEYGIIP